MCVVRGRSDSKMETPMIEGSVGKGMRQMGDAVDTMAEGANPVSHSPGAAAALLYPVASLVAPLAALGCKASSRSAMLLPCNSSAVVALHDSRVACKYGGEGGSSVLRELHGITVGGRGHVGARGGGGSEGECHPKDFFWYFVRAN
jgi:hypothetical protein